MPHSRSPVRTDDNGGEGAVAPQDLPAHRRAQAAGILGHQRDCVAVLVEHGVLVHLLIAQEHRSPAAMTPTVRMLLECWKPSHSK